MWLMSSWLSELGFKEKHMGDRGFSSMLTLTGFIFWVPIFDNHCHFWVPIWLRIFDMFPTTGFFSFSRGPKQMEDHDTYLLIT